MLKKYSEIWKRVEKLLKIEFDSKPVYGDDDKYIKTKIKICSASVNTVTMITIMIKCECQKKKHHAIVYQ